jgi:hypothetical protein
VLPGGLDQLVLDSTLGVAKIGVVCAAGALSAKFVSTTHIIAFLTPQHTAPELLGADTKKLLLTCCCCCSQTGHAE